MYRARFGWRRVEGNFRIQDVSWEDSPWELRSSRDHRASRHSLRDGLRWPYFLARRVRRGWHGRLDDRIDGPPRLAVQDIDEPILVRRSDCSNRSPTDLDVKKCRLLACVVVPEIMMDLLEIPLQLSGFQIQRHE